MNLNNNYVIRREKMASGSGEGPLFKLRATCDGHKGDVRAVAPTVVPEGQFVSVSRDKTCRLWRPHPDKQEEFVSAVPLEGHANFVISVCVTRPDDNYPEGLIYTGSNDRTILAYIPDVPDPIFKLEGHANAVSALFAGKFGTLLSGSWDQTAKVWLQQKCVMTLSEHEAAIWAVNILPSGSMLTGSADKTIKLWTAGKRVRTYSGHTDCVRALAALNNDEFLSTANDATIRRWRVSGECVQVYNGHESFVYSVCILSSGNEFATTGEDRTLRIWGVSESGCRQSITLPAISVWTCCPLANGDVVVGSSDGVIRIFTSSPDRYAPEEELVAFQTQVSSSVVPHQSQGGGTTNGINIAELPGKENLQHKGSREGQTQLIRVGNNVEVYQWNAATTNWDKIGDMVADAGGAAKSDKIMYEGTEYDYVFTVELDGQPSLKLPYNVAEDPWMAAHKWLEKHELSPLFLDQVANFIITNTKGEQLGASGTPGFADPFTGGGRYVPEGAANPDAAERRPNAADPFTGGGRYVPESSGGGAAGGSSADPFTGGGRYVPGGSSAPVTESQAKHQAPVSSSNPYFPCTDYVTFEQAKPDAILKKLRDFNEALGADHAHRLNDTALEAMRELACGGLEDVPSAEQMEILPNIIIHWPQESVFPAIDILRLIIRRESVSKVLFDPSKGPRFIQLIYALMHESQPETNKMLALRCLANAFTHLPGVFLMLAQQSQVTTHAMTLIATSKNKGSHVALATVLLNYAVAVTRLHSKLADVEEPVGQIITCADLLLHCATDPECVFRCLCAVGSLLDPPPSAAGGVAIAKHAAAFVRGCELPVFLNRILTNQSGLAETPTKVTEAAQHVDRLLLS